MASLIYLVLYFYFHACSARPLVVVLDKQIHHPNSKEDARSLVVMQFDKDQINASALLKEAARTKGNKIKMQDSWKVLLNAADKEVWKKAMRSTLESESPCNAEETHVNSKEKHTEEDIVVMDYAQPHRKPPIHNRGT